MPEVKKKLSDEESNSFDRGVEFLSKRARWLQNQAVLILFITLIHVGLLMAFFFVFTQLENSVSGLLGYSEVLGFIVMVDFLIFLMAILSLVLFDRHVKIGKIYFSEISNEGNWEGEDEERLRLEYRLALRKFMIATDLPLSAEGKGVPTYFFLNFAMSLTIWVTAFFLLLRVYPNFAIQ